MGYWRAGFDVVGVDIEPQPHYPFEFHRADALRAATLWKSHGVWPGVHSFDAIHASPPCQAYSLMNNRVAAAHPDLVAPVRELLEASGLPWVMENVPGSPCARNLLLCGSMFGLGVLRHRHFESSSLLMSPGHCDHQPGYVGVYGDGPRPNNTGRETNQPDGYSRAGPCTFACSSPGGDGHGLGRLARDQRGDPTGVHRVHRCTAAAAHRKIARRGRAVSDGKSKVDARKDEHG